MMCTLTPTVRLNSFAMTRQIAPVYKEITTQVEETETEVDTKKSLHKPRRETNFTFILSFDGCEVEGFARTKQRAKHNAAEKLLENLKLKYPLEFSSKGALSEEDAMLTMLAEKKLTPVYQYVREEGGAENRMYTVSCTVSTLVVQGQGRGKKLARIEAAKKVLQYFKDHDKPPGTEKTKDVPATNIHVSKAPILEKIENCPFSDPVSVLQEYLVHNNLNPPEYTLEHIDKVYTMTCRAGGISYSASARNKKLAKQCSAAGVVNIMAIKERPKKKPKKVKRNTRYKFRYPSPQLVSLPRQYGYDRVLARSKVYEPSQRALNFSRRNPGATVDEESNWMPQQRAMQNYYDMF